MNLVTTGTYLMGYLGMLMIPAGIGVVVGIYASDEDSAPRRYWRMHVEHMRRQIDEMFLGVKAEDIALYQVSSSVLLLVIAALFGEALLVLVVVIIAIGPELWLTSERKTRITQMEEQLAQWLMLLANALRATPSVGAAVEASVKLLPVPLRSHVDLVVKEMRLGVPVERALLNMGKRIDSQTLQSALATVVISQRTGGDVPRLLEESASGLREMARLEGIIRAKTAEGKMQAIVLAVVPIVLAVVVSQLKPGWFDPLFATPMGYGLMALTVFMWVGALYAANRVLDVEV